MRYRGRFWQPWSFTVPFLRTSHSIGRICGSFITAVLARLEDTNPCILSFPLKRWNACQVVLYEGGIGRCRHGGKR